MYATLCCSVFRTTLKAIWCRRHVGNGVLQLVSRKITIMPVLWMGLSDTVGQSWRNRSIQFRLVAVRNIGPISFSRKNYEAT